MKYLQITLALAVMLLAMDISGVKASTQTMQETSATETIRKLAGQATINDDAHHEKFLDLMNEYFAMDVISRFVLGRYWRSVSPEEFNEFSGLLQQYLAPRHVDVLHHLEFDRLGRR